MPQIAVLTNTKESASISILQFKTRVTAISRAMAIVALIFDGDGKKPLVNKLKLATWRHDLRNRAVRADAQPQRL